MGNRLNRHGGGGSDAVARGLSHGREGTVYRSAKGAGREHDGVMRAVRNQPQDRVQVVPALSGRGAGGNRGAIARAARDSMGDKRGPGRGDSGGAPRASELGPKKAARQVARARARTGLARAEYYRRVAAP